MTVPTAEQIALIRQLLPNAALTDYGWTDQFISDLMDARNFSTTEAVRYFWLQRVNETSEYLDINGKPLTQIHASARDMLTYWDGILARGREAIDPNSKRPISFGEIERPTG